MTRRATHASVLAVAAGAAVAILAVAALWPLVASQDDPREVVLVARGMRFYLDGHPEANPTIALEAGERVRLVLRNEDPGVTHDFAVAAWGVATGALQGRGVAVVEFRAPGRPGAYRYRCTPHPLMMSGALEVE